MRIVVHLYGLSLRTLFAWSTEGTTTNGGFLLPFKTGAFLSKAPVLPVILKYPYQRFSPAWESISGVSCLTVYIWYNVIYILNASLFIFLCRV